jgi:hypothetical protein
MRRRRVRRQGSQAALIGSTAVAALAGFAAGVFLMQRSGGLRAVWQRLAEFRGDDDRDEGTPPDSVYQTLGVAHDDSDYGDSQDAIEDDPGDDAAASEVEKRVLAAFLNDPVLAGAPVEISAEGDGVVELNGWVEERDARRHAATIAAGVPGVIGVANNIRVRRPRRVSTS